MENKKNHYVYQINYKNGMKYIGVRSCNCNIEDDKYTGSGFHIPKEINIIVNKEILSVHNTRKEAMEEEIQLHKLYDVKNNDNFYNQCNASSTKFIVGKDAVKRAAETRRGRTKDTHDYIRRQCESRKKYKGNLTYAQQKAVEKMIKANSSKESKSLARGDERTEKQKQGAKRQAEKIRGVKNKAKGHPGITSTSFVPWYYITPEGKRVEVYDKTKKEYVDQLPFTMRQLSHRFHHSNKHKPGKTGIFKGWTFGNIITPKQSQVQRNKYLTTGER